MAWRVLLRAMPIKPANNTRNFSPTGKMPTPISQFCSRPRSNIGSYSNAFRESARPEVTSDCWQQAKPLIENERFEPRYEDRSWKRCRVWCIFLPLANHLGKNPRCAYHVARDQGETTSTQATVEVEYCKSTLSSI